ncbi:hypothetical protein PBRA_005209 [Plasmodiophora brassicae]|uniref:Uncharacterized protein n=1 Tax=Plasmodiophora brassicae TaxID=37360 RepID=A0A0G4IN32_PLABS|nr:hypothetical protein PBRA_005209 [Plasmodiophora brassicae]
MTTSRRRRVDDDACTRCHWDPCSTAAVSVTSDSFRTNGSCGVVLPRKRLRLGTRCSCSLDTVMRVQGRHVLAFLGISVDLSRIARVNRQWCRMTLPLMDNRDVLFFNWGGRDRFFDSVSCRWLTSRSIRNDMEVRIVAPIDDFARDVLFTRLFQKQLLLRDVGPLVRYLYEHFRSGSPSEVEEHVNSFLRTVVFARIGAALYIAFGRADRSKVHYLLHLIRVSDDGVVTQLGPDAFNDAQHFPIVPVHAMRFRGFILFGIRAIDDKVTHRFRGINLETCTWTDLPPPPGLKLFDSHSLTVWQDSVIFTKVESVDDSKASTIWKMALVNDKFQWIRLPELPGDCVGQVLLGNLHENLIAITWGAVHALLRDQPTSWKLLWAQMPANSPQLETHLDLDYRLPWPVPLKSVPR